MRSNALFLAAAVAVVLPSAAVAQDTEWNRYTLENLTGVYIRAEADATCEAAGVSAATVQAEAEAALFEAVTVLTEQEMLAAPGLPELRITLACAAGENGVSEAIAYSVSVRVQQAVQMIRDNQITLAEAVTWYAAQVGVAERGDAQERIEEAIGAKLEEFTVAYAAANADDQPGR